MHACIEDYRRLWLRQHVRGPWNWIDRLRRWLCFVTSANVWTSDLLFEVNLRFIGLFDALRSHPTAEAISQDCSALGIPELANWLVSRTF